ncbi:flagellar basal body L-ring protein FlgH [Sphingomonas sp.]|jgi:flagellar L-ring protein precursor FlgH|uniref:flagellar basal body L-ring protein FlgH n=1 Tax=Sphingomonas sp. TaxID=28214 RepID=UPI002E2FBC4A|nr:flagellar basal body L-ring protein FlgH [Sphingomonas sp.]HEX4695804.1 flagellar basal body L-ring protein FlgH [Sphingomonas sp.]
MKRAAFVLVTLAMLPFQAAADDLYKRNNWSAMSADRRASAVGDLLTVVVYENSESSNTAKSDSSRSTKIGGSVSGGSLNESGNLQIGGGYTGGGGVSRSDKLVAQITVRIVGVLANGDMLVSGQQTMKINGESTLIGIEGRVRADDITGDNRILSSRVADAKIIYDGKGFVARSAKPGLIARVFRFLGLG